MAKKSAVYLFERDERSPSGFMSPNEAATDAAGVVLNWSAVGGRSFQTLLDRHDIFIAYLTYDENREQDAADDLNQRCRHKGLTPRGITEQQAEKLRSDFLASPSK